MKVSFLNRIAPGVGGALLLLLGSAACQAAFVEPAWTRPTNDAEAIATQTTYQAWDFFVDPDGGFNPEGDPVDPADTINYPDIAEVNPNGPLSDPSNLANTTPDAAYAYDSSWSTSGAFLVGGNIYSPTEVITPRAVVPGYAAPGSATRFLVQVRSRGDLIDTGLTLNGVPVNTLPGYSYQELSSVPLPGGFGGDEVDHAWTFTAPADLASFTLDWSWGVSSASLASLSIDTQVVPEPSTALLALGGAVGVVGVARRIRRRKAH